MLMRDAEGRKKQASKAIKTTSIQCCDTYIHTMYMYTVCTVNKLTSSQSTGRINSLNFLSARSLLVASLRNILNSLSTLLLCRSIFLSSSGASSRGLGGGAICSCSCWTTGEREGGIEGERERERERWALIRVHVHLSTPHPSPLTHLHHSEVSAVEAVEASPERLWKRSELSLLVREVVERTSH